MKAFATLARFGRVLLIVSLASMLADQSVGQNQDGANGVGSTQPVTVEDATEAKRNERREFQTQELMLAKSGTWMFKPGETPRIVWRDVETVRRLGCSESLRVRWFDKELNESPEPNASGRWLAWIEGTAPNGTPLRRSLTFYGLPTQLLGAFAADLTVAFPNFPGPDAPAVLHEHESEIVHLANKILVRAVLGSEQGAILVAGLTESEPLGRPARYIESTTVQNDDCHLALKLKLQELQGETRRLRPPRHRNEPATMLGDGSPSQAGVAADAKDRIDAVCREWAEDSGEPFVTLVARRGVIITHEAFGEDVSGQPIDRDYRCWVASITKTVTAILFSQFLDQGLIDLDDSLAMAFPDYTNDNPHVPTFRQCFTHTSGLSGHGELGDMHTPHLENVVLNGIDVNEPGVGYAYCGLGFELVAKAMEIVAGKSAVRLYDEHLFQPLEFGDVRMGNASSDGEFTAWELGVLAQWMANRGSYGTREFIRPETFEQLLPQPLALADQGNTVEEGIGIHWQRHLKPGAPPASKRDEDLLFGRHSLGHGSFSGCIFFVDPDQQLIIVQVRKNSGPRSAEWSSKFFQTVAAVAVE
ncbi:serine hydrolase domain-containing protein [Aporhodopirellula aestuarii]|uniref:Beta-lactamase family protein n=1 Tax=Aporhodopirellula aestuarii TaxID=2950107 RepID=A0ABT0TY28_9BACT|nr:serine hydrolase domain-containing protein [Aporhodopirellula aestuarii]MCM2369502.1 beta-lactamase family protein [Aporhodopirellula aestuarii]